MIFPTRTDRRVRFSRAGVAAAIAVVSLTLAPLPAQARVWVSVGGPFPGYYYGPGPYYDYPAPYGYASPPGYYPPAAYPAPEAYPPAPGASPSAYTPSPYNAPYDPPAAGMQPVPGAPPAAAAAPAAKPRVTYTNKPAFTNSAGQTCREYRASDASGGRAVDVFGTACKQADGQWRVVN
jgi:hypothetical protein